MTIFRCQHLQDWIISTWPFLVEFWYQVSRLQGGQPKSEISKTPRRVVTPELLLGYAEESVPPQLPKETRVDPLPPEKVSQNDLSHPKRKFPDRFDDLVLHQGITLHGFQFQSPKDHEVNSSVKKSHQINRKTSLTDGLGYSQEPSPSER